MLNIFLEPTVAVLYILEDAPHFSHLLYFSSLLCCTNRGSKEQVRILVLHACSLCWQWIALMSRWAAEPMQLKKEFRDLIRYVQLCNFRSLALKFCSFYFCFPILSLDITLHWLHM